MSSVPAMPQRVFLFLQGTSSWLFPKTANALEAKGHRCLRINFNVGDQIFWARKGGHNYRGSFEAWPDYIAAFLARHRVTDLILLGEERPYHRLAVIAAQRHGTKVYVVEMGYLRPDWLTLERDGMSSNSHFPADPAYILQAARTLPEPDWKQHYRQTFRYEACTDLLYNLPNVFLWFLFPFYRRFRLLHPFAEYAGWITRLWISRRRREIADAQIERLLRVNTPFFIYPLQLETDFQLRSHSPYNDQQEAIDEVLTSFSRHAPQTSHLLVKLHPLDEGLTDWQKTVADMAGRLDIGARVHFLDGGDLNALLQRCLGVVTVNSTVGLHALQQLRPVKVLGAAVFDIAGLSDARPLDDFWKEPAIPDSDLRDAFLRLMAATIQVRGNFYSAAGSTGGALAIAERLHKDNVNEPGAFIDPPPRRRPIKRSVPGG